MKNYADDTYGEYIAGVYDQWYSEVDSDSIHTLNELAYGGPALELGIGTGRIALPLMATGVTVHGVDASGAMISKLRQKPAGDGIPVTMGSFADLPVEGQFSLIYIVFNTFFALLTQDEQVRCFQNVAKHLSPSGVFVVEVFVPELGRFDRGQTVRLDRIGESETQLDVSQIELVQQVITSQHIHLTEGETHFYPVKLRYAWPAEMDLMARLAGMRLKHRWGDWKRGPFTAQSGKHISVYELSAE
jgi:SAM-dependent methyltransferase